MTAVWLLPIVAAEVAAVSGALLVPHLSPSEAFIVLILCYALWACSVPLAMSILVILLLRLVLHKLPNHDLAATGWLALGPIGTGALGLLLLGGDAPAVFKPQPKVYLVACGAFNLKPEQVMMCAAHSGDLSSAQKLGCALATSGGRGRAVRVLARPNRQARSISWARTFTTSPTSLGSDRAGRCLNAGLTTRVSLAVLDKLGTDVAVKSAQTPSRDAPVNLAFLTLLAAAAEIAATPSLVRRGGWARPSKTSRTIPGVLDPRPAQGCRCQKPPRPAAPDLPLLPRHNITIFRDDLGQGASFEELDVATKSGVPRFLRGFST
jgi:hypothetical protein